MEALFAFGQLSPRERERSPESEGAPARQILGFGHDDPARWSRIFSGGLALLHPGARRRLAEAADETG